MNFTNNIKFMSKKNILIISIGGVLVVAIVVILAINGNWFNKEKRIEQNRENSVTIQDNGVVKIKNLIQIVNGEFKPNKLDIKIGELVSFESNTESPVKMIGDGWQTPFMPKGAVFTKSDFKDGQNKIYLEGNPNSICIINVR